MSLFFLVLKQFSVVPNKINKSMDAGTKVKPPTIMGHIKVMFTLFRCTLYRQWVSECAALLIFNVGARCRKVDSFMLCTFTFGRRSS